MTHISRLCFLFFAAHQIWQAESPTRSKVPECSETPRENRLSVIAPMAGTSPVWLVDAAEGAWSGLEKPVKTAWIVDRSHPGDLRVTGRRLDGEGSVRFKNGVYGSIVDELVIPNAHRMGMIPGGATPDDVRDYAFHSSYVIYPSPGCWELIARIGEDAVKVVLKMKDSQR